MNTGILSTVKIHPHIVILNICLLFLQEVLFPKLFSHPLLVIDLIDSVKDNICFFITNFFDDYDNVVTVLSYFE